MRVKDFIFKEDENGCEYVEFIEDPKKNGQGGLKPIQRKTNPKMLLWEKDSLSRLLRFYLAKRPDSMQENFI